MIRPISALTASSSSRFLNAALSPRSFTGSSSSSMTGSTMCAGGGGSRFGRFVVKSKGDASCGGAEGPPRSRLDRCWPLWAARGARFGSADDPRPEPRRQRDPTAGASAATRATATRRASTRTGRTGTRRSARRLPKAARGGVKSKVGRVVAAATTRIVRGSRSSRGFGVDRPRATSSPRPWTTATSSRTRAAPTTTARAGPTTRSSGARSARRRSCCGPRRAIASRRTRTRSGPPATPSRATPGATRRARPGRSSPHRPR